MQFLPSLSAGQSVWRLPLADWSAALLAEALLVEEVDERRRLMAAVLADDPALALWTICRAEQLGSATVVQTVSVAGHWLSGRLLDALADCDERPPEPPVVASTDIRRWTELTAGGVATAHAATLLADAHQPVDTAQACLLGLVHAAADWLGSVGPPVSLEDCGAAAACLPKWLVASLKQIRDEPVGLSPATVVAEARQLLSADPTRRAKLLDWAPHQQCVDHVKRRWSSTVPGAGGSLYRLADRLARLERLEREFTETLQLEKLASMKQLAYGAGHEINNPLANISTRAQTLLQDERVPERRRRLAAINSQALRAHEMIADMMLFARPPRLNLESVALNALIDRLIAELTPLAACQSTTICCAMPAEPLLISADATQLAVALKAMCINSLEAIGNGGRIEITLRPRALDDDGSEEGAPIQIVVADTGPGIEPEARRHLFDPYYSGREAGRGLGLGLSKCWRIVDGHGGRIDVESEPRGGATFTITLPVEATPRVETGRREDS